LPPKALRKPSSIALCHFTTESTTVCKLAQPGAGRNGARPPDPLRSKMTPCLSLVQSPSPVKPPQGRINRTQIFRRHPCARRMAKEELGQESFLREVSTPG